MSCLTDLDGRQNGRVTSLSVTQTMLSRRARRRAELLVRRGAHGGQTYRDNAIALRDTDNASIVHHHKFTRDAACATALQKRVVRVQRGRQVTQLPPSVLRHVPIVQRLHDEDTIFRCVETEVVLVLPHYCFKWLKKDFYRRYEASGLDIWALHDTTHVSC